MAVKFNTKYAVRLAPLQSSFFDPESGCNLFRSTPVYAFNHEPTRNLITGVKHGSLVDLIGNVLGEKEVVQEAESTNADANVDEKTAANKTAAKGGKAKDKADSTEADK